MAELVEYQKELSAWIRSVSGQLDLAVAFWGKGAVEELGLDRAGLNVRILLDLKAGGTNPEEVRRLRRAVGRDNVKCRNRLHAKAYITPHRMLVGSANASANGLGAEGFEATHWHELGLLTEDRRAIAQAQAWFEQHWGLAEFITPKMLADAAERWKSNRSKRAFVSSRSTGLLEAAIANPDDFTDHEIYVVVSTEALDERGEAAIKARRKALGHEVYAFQSWPEIPINAVLVCFSHDGNAGFQADEPMVYLTEQQSRRSLMKWADPLRPDRIIEGFKVENVRVWRERLTTAMQINRGTWKREGGMCQRLDEFVRATNTSRR